MIEQKQLLILGSGEIARLVADMGRHLPWGSLTIAEADIHLYEIDAEGITLLGQSWPDAPWHLGAGTHVLIARAHDRDPVSVESALDAGAEHVYLVASAKRAMGIIEGLGIVEGDERFGRLSAPAGLDLGGQSSGAIALSILAEMQWRTMGAQGSCRPMTESRSSRAQASVTGQRFDQCPGQRP